MKKLTTEIHCNSLRCIYATCGILYTTIRSSIIDKTEDISETQQNLQKYLNWSYSTIVPVNIGRFKYL